MWRMALRIWYANCFVPRTAVELSSPNYEDFYFFLTGNAKQSIQCLVADALMASGTRSRSIASPPVPAMLLTDSCDGAPGNAPHNRSGNWVSQRHNAEKLIFE